MNYLQETKKIANTTEILLDIFNDDTISSS